MIKKFLTLCLLFVVTQASASVVVTGTRFVYLSSEKEISINLENSGEKPILIQTWLTTGFSEKRAEKEPSRSEIEDTPFIILPPLFKISPNNAQTVRVIYTGETLPKDRESIFTFNVLDIPQKSKKEINNLQISVLSKFKFFYRPVEILDSYNTAIDKLDWQLVKEDNNIYLSVKNTTPFFITINKAKVTINNVEYKTQQDFNMLIPITGQEKVKLSNLNQLPNQPVKIEFNYINDSGGNVDVTKTIN